MDFKELLDYCKASAILNTLEPTELSVWRSICRTYAKTFSTPLHVVEEDLDPEKVMLAVFEEQLEDFDETKDLDHLLDRIYSLEDPTYESQKKEELNDFIDRAEAEEEERVKNNKPIHPSLRNEVSIQETLPEKPKKKEMPKSGGIDLSYLEREELSGGLEE